MSTDFDYSDHIEKPSNEAFTELNELVEAQTQAAAEVIRLQEQLTLATDQLRLVSEVAIPALMDKLTLSDFTTSTGFNITVEENMRASISEANAPSAYRWLEEQGEAGIIKNTVKVEFARNEDELANAFVRESLGNGLKVQLKKSVNFQTLGKFVRDRLAAGEDVPEDIFTLFRQRVAKVTT